MKFATVVNPCWCKINSGSCHDVRTGVRFESVPGNLKHKPSSGAMSILLLASRMDSASLNIYSELMDTVGWEEVEMDHGMVSRHHSGLAEALLIEDLHIWADGIDMEHQSETGREVDEVLVL